MRQIVFFLSLFLLCGGLRGEDILFRFLQLSDTEVSGKGDPANWGKDVEQYIRKEPVSFILISGDLAANHNAGLNFMKKVITQSRWGTTFYVSNGNHDFTESKPSDKHFRKLFGPLWYSFDVQGVHFAVTPMIWSGQGQAAARPVSYKTMDFLEWLKKDLESLPQATPVVLVNHNCFLNDPEICRYLKLERFNIRAFLCGHNHFSRKKIISGIPVYTTSCFSKGGCASPSAFAVYTVSAKGEITRSIHYPESRSRTVPDRRQLWQADIPGGNCIFASPLLWKDSVIAFISDEAEAKTCGVYAFDRRTGKRKWYFHTGNSVKSCGIIWKDTLFVCDIDENLYSIDPANGTLRWKRKLRTTGDSMYIRGCVIFQDTVIAGSADSLCCLRCSDGSVVWKSIFPANRMDIYGFPHTLSKNILLTSGPGYECAGVDAGTGKILWRIPTRKKTLRPVLLNGTWYAIHSTGFWGRFDPGSGKISSRKKFSSSLHHPVVLWDNAIVAGSEKHGLLFYSPEQLKQQGQFLPEDAVLTATPYFSTGRKAVDSELLVWKGKLIFAGSDGKIYCLEPGSRKLVWSIAAGDVVTGLTLSGNELYAATFSGKIIGYQLQGGKNVL